MNKKLIRLVKPKFYDDVKEYANKIKILSYNKLVNTIKAGFLNEYANKCISVFGQKDITDEFKNNDITHLFIESIYNKYIRTEEDINNLSKESLDLIKYRYIDLENIVLNTLSIMFYVDYDPYETYNTQLHDEIACASNNDIEKYVRWRGIAPIIIDDNYNDMWEFVEINEPVVITNGIIDTDKTIENIKNNAGVDRLIINSSEQDIFNYFANGKMDVGPYCIKCYTLY